MAESSPDSVDPWPAVPEEVSTPSSEQEDAALADTADPPPPPMRTALRVTRSAVRATVSDPQPAIHIHMSSLRPLGVGVGVVYF